MSGQALLPNLRFPEFSNGPEWGTVALSAASVPIDERVGNRKLTPVSISAGIGFVRQSEKFGRDISGNQYQFYTLVRDGDFVFNKGNSSKFPQGCVYLLQGWGEVAAPNVFICFRLREGYSNAFFQNCFEANVHGIQLQRHITSSARSNGLLNISKETFFGVNIPTPSFAEQTKIAECLTSLDEVIGAERREFEALRRHKKGLLQRLFPRPERIENGETIPAETNPRLRFPEFQNAGEWLEEALVDLIQLQDGFSFKSTDFVSDTSNTTQVVRITDINNQNNNTDKVFVRPGFIEANNLGKYMINDGDLLLSLTGAAGFKFFVWNGGRAALNQRTAKVTARKPEHQAVLRLIETLLEDRINERGEGQNNNLSREFLSTIVLRIPRPREQLRIAECLASLDAIISAQSKKVQLLTMHKRGLMQGLFPVLEDVTA